MSRSGPHRANTTNPSKPKPSIPTPEAQVSRVTSHKAPRQAPNTVPAGRRLRLVAYAGVDHERGPAFVGAAVLGLFIVLTGLQHGPHGSLVGWPLFLLVIGGARLAIGLRPREPLLAIPGQPTSETTTPTVPLRKKDDT